MSRRAGFGQRRRTLAAACTAAVALAGAFVSGIAPAAAATAYESQTVKVTSFDGVQLNVNFFPAKGLTTGQVAPTVLVGSGWGAPAYPSWLGLIGTIGVDALNIHAGLNLLGPAALTDAGYNVITWDNRGWYASGGQVSLDSPAVEGRDVSAILDWLAKQPAAQLNGPNDPMVGMTGASYGGGIQLSAAIVDHRLDAIEPNMSWNSLIDSLYPNAVIKSGWGDTLCSTGSLVGAKYAPGLTDICGAAQTGVVTPAEVAFGSAASPGAAVGKITTPTLLLGGTVDTLFPLAGNIATYNYLKAAGTPVTMVWYCGGHGICNFNTGPTTHVTDLQMAFLNKYLKGATVPASPGFEYLDQTGFWRSAASYPVPTTGTVTGTGSGQLAISPKNTSGVLGVAASPASNALNIRISAPHRPAEVLGAPTVSLTYQGTSTPAKTQIFAQLVDPGTSQVVGNQVTPIPVTLDGASHTVTLPLSVAVWRLTPFSQLELQLTDSTNLFIAQKATGTVNVQHAQLTLATAAH